MYNQTAQVSNQRKDVYFSGIQSGRRTQKKQSHRQEQVRLFQLLICLALFLAVFIGKGVFPSKLLQVRDNILSMISSDTDFQAAFSELGESLSGEGTVFGKLEDFCVEVFGGGEDSSQKLSVQPEPQMTSLLQTESQFLSKNSDSQALSDHFFDSNGREVALKLQLNQKPQAEPVAVPEEVPAAVPAAGTLLLKSDYNGQPLPENYTMNKLSLGSLETVTPVIGHLNSTYSYREHPINGVHQFHGGVDIGGQTGDPIKAFAAGTVDYIGEDDSYGLYLQLDHGNGVKSFYAHCHTICVTKGQQVTLGEKIAEVGSSGSATGPHLHLELKYNNIHLNPIYYIEYLSNQ